MILGFNDGHDAAAALANQQGLQYATQEERLTRIKHTSDFPFESIKWLLNRAHEENAEIAALAVPRSNVPRSTALAFDSDLTIHDISRLDSPQDRSLLDHAVTKFTHDPVGFPRSAAAYALRAITSTDGSNAPDLSPRLRIDDLPDQLDLYHCHHHEAHAASTFHTSNFDDALVVTLDGAGNGYSGSIWQAKNGQMEPKTAFPTHGSLGWFYALVTDALGWWVGNGEGKTMGLAAFTDPDPSVVDALREYCPLYEDGKLVESRSFTPQAYKIQGVTRWTFEESAAVKFLVDEYGAKEVASAAERLLEEQVENIIIPWLERADASNLATAGGVFLNVTLNRKLHNRDDIDEYFIFPAAGDAGLAAGAALAAQATIGSVTTGQLESASLGPTLLEDADYGDITEFLDVRGVNYLTPDDTVDATAELLADGQIVAWCQGRSEYGPRALGNRSILIDPTLANSSVRVNDNVKFRDSWRPFAPSVLDEAANDYFVDCPRDPFMIKSANVQPGKKREIPAVVHVDDTSRPHVVTESSAPRYYELISAFRDRTGVPILLNTSYNLSGDPIVCSASDALTTFVDCGLDALVLDDFIIQKQQL